MKFAKVRLACLGCKAPLDPGATDLCEHCRPKVRAPCISTSAPTKALQNPMAAAGPVKHRQKH